MSYLAAFVNAAKLLAVAETGILAGGSIATTYGVNTSLLKSDIPPQAKVKIWMGYINGLMPYPMVIMGTSSLLFLGTAYHRHTLQPFYYETVWGISEGTQLGLAAVLLLSNVVARQLVDPHGLATLIQRSKAIEVAQKSGQEAVIDPEVLEQELKRWRSLSTIQTVLALAAFLLGVTSF